MVRTVTQRHNPLPVGVAEAVASEFLDVVEDGYVANDWLTFCEQSFSEALGLKEPTPEPPANPAAPQPASTYAGTYTNDYYGTATVTANADGSLTAAVGPKPVVVPLTPWDADTFATELKYGEIQPSGELFPAVEFTVADGQATQMQFAWLQAPGQEIFTRQP